MSNLSSNNSPKPPFDPKKSLGLDEWITIIVALATFGPIFFWMAGKKELNAPALATSNETQPEASGSQQADSEVELDNLTFVALSNDPSYKETTNKCEMQPHSVSIGQLIPVSTEISTPAPMYQAVAPQAPAPMYQAVTPQAAAPQTLSQLVDPSDPPTKTDRVETSVEEKEPEIMSLAEATKDWKKMNLPIALNSRKGEMLLMESSSRMDYLPLTMEFVSQEKPGYSGVASAVMALNALYVPAPKASGFDGQYEFFTQENIFHNKATQKIVLPEAVSSESMTLKQLTQFVQSHGIQAKAHHGSEIGLDEFRSKLVENLEQGYNFILVNYSRESIGQDKGTHISPVAAYNKESDRFLILDVSRYKYAPIWVTAEQLWEGTKAKDPTSGESMGFVWVGQ